MCCLFNIVVVGTSLLVVWLVLLGCCMFLLWVGLRLCIWFGCWVLTLGWGYCYMALVVVLYYCLRLGFDVLLLVVVNSVDYFMPFAWVFGLKLVL